MSSKVCKFWKQRGSCFYDDKCHYAHPKQTIDSNRYTAMITPKLIPSSSSSYFIPDQLETEFAQYRALMISRLQPDDPLFQSIPSSLNFGKYHSLFPLEQIDGFLNKVHARSIDRFGYASWVFKVTRSTDGTCFACVRLESFPIDASNMGAQIAAWQGVNSPNIVGLRDVFSTQEFGDGGSLCFIYDYYPGAFSIEQKYLSNASSLLREDALWSIIVQLVLAVLSTHSANMALRIIEPSKVIVTGLERIRIICAGILDCVHAIDSNETLARHQLQDIRKLGKLVLSLACMSTTATERLNHSIDFAGAQYSVDLKDFLTATLHDPHPQIFNICSLIHHRISAETQKAFAHSDALYRNLALESDNGRLFRLVCKLGFINERPDFQNNPTWSETGNNYLLKLFRSFVFHQVDEQGNPVLDFNHVASALNMLDVASPEKVLLMDQQQENMLIVGFDEIKGCIDKSIAELRKDKK